MSVVLGILKVIGIIILILIGLVLAAVLAVLFVPIRYRGHICYDKKLSGRAYASFLLHILHLTVCPVDGKLFLFVRLFGITIKKKPLGGKDTDGDDTETTEDTEKIVDSEKSEDTEKTVDSEKTEGIRSELPDDMPVIDDQTEAEDKPEEKKSEEEKSEEGKSEEGKSEEGKSEADKSVEDKSVEDKSGEDTQKSDSEEEEKSSFADKAASLYNKYVNDHTLGMLARVKKQLVRLLRHILPRSVRGHLHFGFEDPSKTGLVLAGLGMFYRRVRFLRTEPSFDSPCFDADVRIRGHVRIGTVVFFVLLLILNKDYKYVKKNILNK